MKSEKNTEKFLFVAALYSYPWSTHSVMVIITGNEHGKLSSNLDEVVCISHRIFKKGMNAAIFPPAMRKYKSRLGSCLWYGNQSRSRKTWRTLLKNWSCVTSCSCGGVG